MFLWGDIGRLATAINRLADEWKRQNEAQAQQDAFNQEQTAAMTRLADINEQAVKAREEWQQIEREHMAVCERRFHARQDGGESAAPVKR